MSSKKQDASTKQRARSVSELLAPAGDPDCAYAAFAYGADAIYLGLKSFSARAQAVNFTIQQLEEIINFAHSQGRRVFLTLNTVIGQRELASVIDCLSRVVEAGIDALIVQDLAVARLARRFFPELELHASTQMAIHNLAGAKVLRSFGFSRVTLARELTFAEVADISKDSGVETEVFIHGALCYSYSGLCFFSSFATGRSGNRGSCAYPCRDCFQAEGNGVSKELMPFSMKDLALGTKVLDLVNAGVSCLKIEGRMKSALYVGAVVDYYRSILRGAERVEILEKEENLKTVFARPFTPLYFSSAKSKNVVDSMVSGHRGALIGEVERITRGSDGSAFLRFRSSRELELHDGLQIDLPGQARPFGFSASKIISTQGRGGRPLFKAAAGTTIDMLLPEEAPFIPNGAPIYCSSSQRVKQQYKVVRPKAGEYAAKHRLAVRATLTGNLLVIEGEVALPLPYQGTVCRKVSSAGPFAFANEPDKTAPAFERAFSRLGDSQFVLGSLSLENEEQLFVQASELNRLRRELTANLAAAFDDERERFRAQLNAQAHDESLTEEQSLPVAANWLLKTDRLDSLQALEQSDWAKVSELLILLNHKGGKEIVDQLEQLGLSSTEVRFSLPVVTRSWEAGPLAETLDYLLRLGHTKWEISNLSGIEYLHDSCLRLGLKTESLNLSSDWTISVLNSIAPKSLSERGITRVTLSPEDSKDNIAWLLWEFGSKACVVVYQDTPLFISEACVAATMQGGCPGAERCSFSEISSEGMEHQVQLKTKGIKVRSLTRGCRTVVIGEKPFSLALHIPELIRLGASNLRLDFVTRHYEPRELRDIWRAITGGGSYPLGHDGNFARGFQVTPTAT